MPANDESQLEAPNTRSILEQLARTDPELSWPKYVIRWIPETDEDGNAIFIEINGRQQVKGKWETQCTVKYRGKTLHAQSNGHRKQEANSYAAGEVLKMYQEAAKSSKSSTAGEGISKDAAGANLPPDLSPNLPDSLRAKHVLRHKDCVFILFSALSQDEASTFRDRNQNPLLSTSSEVEAVYREFQFKGLDAHAFTWCNDPPKHPKDHDAFESDDSMYKWVPDDLEVHECSSDLREQVDKSDIARDCRRGSRSKELSVRMGVLVAEMAAFCASMVTSWKIRTEKRYISMKREEDEQKMEAKENKEDHAVKVKPENGHDEDTKPPVSPKPEAKRPPFTIYIVGCDAVTGMRYSPVGTIVRQLQKAGLTAYLVPNLYTLYAVFTYHDIPCGKWADLNKEKHRIERMKKKMKDVKSKLDQLIKSPKHKLAKARKNLKFDGTDILVADTPEEKEQRVKTIQDMKHMPHSFLFQQTNAEVATADTAENIHLHVKGALTGYDISTSLEEAYRSRMPKPTPLTDNIGALPGQRLNGKVNADPVDLSQCHCDNEADSAAKQEGVERVPYSLEEVLSLTCDPSNPPTKLPSLESEAKETPPSVTPSTPSAPAPPGAAAPTGNKRPRPEGGSNLTQLLQSELSLEQFGVSADTKNDKVLENLRNHLKALRGHEAQILSLIQKTELSLSDDDEAAPSAAKRTKLN